jgi:prephenate dehydratase
VLLEQAEMIDEEVESVNQQSVELAVVPMTNEMQGETPSVLAPERKVEQLL